jgi:hypothetical protein
MSGRTSSVLVAIYNIAHGVCDLQLRSVVLFAGDTDKRHRCAQFSVPMSLQQQSSRIFRLHLSVDFAALHPEHIFSVPLLLAFCIPSWERTSLARSSVCIWKRGVIRNSVMWISPQISHCSSPTIPVAETVYRYMSAYLAFENCRGMAHRTCLHNTLAET